MSTDQQFHGVPSDLPPLCVIVGQTASGKSALAIALAKELGGEIICADSWTVRREVTIGTAKPTAVERAEVPHHLLDIVAPDEDFTAAVFKELANKVIAEIAGRGKLPILVGGTGLYVDGVLYDFGFLPAGDRTGRTELNSLSASELLERVIERGIDHSGIDVRNKRRLIRLLETNGQRATRKPLRDNTVLIGVQLDGPELAERIVERTDAMLAAGLENEVATLQARHGWDCEALKGIGYREWREYFDGSQSLDETRLRIIKATKDLAKRQRTWFKRNKSIHWFTTPVDLTQVVDLVTTTLSK